MDHSKIIMKNFGIGLLEVVRGGVKDLLDNEQINGAQYGQLIGLLEDNKKVLEDKLK